MIIIHKDTRLVGRLETREPVCVAGRMEGLGVCGDLVTVQAGGEWRRRIRARRVRVEGRVEGEIHADESVILMASAQVSGLIRCPRIAIQGGAACTAHLIMGEMEPATDTDDLPALAIRDCA